MASAFITGSLIFLIFPPLNFAAALALGAVISPTDAVAATSLGKRLGLPPRLVTIVVGLVIGFVTVFLRSKLRDPVLDTAISFAVPFIALIPAEKLGASGALVVVVVGL